MKDSSILVLPQLAIERLVLDTLAATGMRTDLALAAAAVIVQGEEVQKALLAWSQWSTMNCLECSHSPSSCAFLNAVHEGSSLRHALGKSIESGPFPCPGRLSRT